ncbi:hypothetical protein PAEPH01_2655, partial [Pancytospora epiphaga]
MFGLHHMASMTKVGRVAGETRGQETRRIYEEAEVLKGESRLLGIGDDKVRFKYCLERASLGLKNFVVREFSGIGSDRQWDEVVSKLWKMSDSMELNDMILKAVDNVMEEKEIEDKKRRERRLWAILYTLMEMVRGVNEAVNRLEVKCRVCGGEEHRGYECP